MRRYRFVKLRLNDLKTSKNRIEFCVYETWNVLYSGLNESDRNILEESGQWRAIDRTKRRSPSSLAKRVCVFRSQRKRGTGEEGAGLSRSLRGQGRKLATSAFSAKSRSSLSFSLSLARLDCRRLLDCETFVKTFARGFPAEILRSRRNSTFHRPLCQPPSSSSSPSSSSESIAAEDRFLVLDRAIQSLGRLFSPLPTAICFDRVSRTRLCFAGTRYPSGGSSVFDLMSGQCFLGENLSVYFVKKHLEIWLTLFSTCD